MSKKQTSPARDTSVVAIVGIVSLTALGLIMGHDGAMLTSSIATIAGIAGYKLGKAKKK